MIVGSGLVAGAFASRFAADRDHWIHAAGVSNSTCSDPAEFARERLRLAQALQDARQARTFVYLSTCSIGDPAAAQSPYVRHKVAMEAMVVEHPGHLIARLPQVAGRTPNPHTLLNYLHGRIARSEALVGWKNASRNIIDIDDAAATVTYLVEQVPARCATVNVANPVSVHVAQVVAALEAVVGKAAIVQWVDTGSRYEIDVRPVLPVYRELTIPFGPRYMLDVLAKYYG